MSLKQYQLDSKIAEKVAPLFRFKKDSIHAAILAYVNIRNFVLDSVQKHLKKVDWEILMDLDGINRSSFSYEVFMSFIGQRLKGDEYKSLDYVDCYFLNEEMLRKREFRKR